MCLYTDYNDGKNGNKKSVRLSRYDGSAEEVLLSTSKNSRWKLSLLFWDICLILSTINFLFLCGCHWGPSTLVCPGSMMLLRWLCCSHYQAGEQAAVPPFSYPAPLDGDGAKVIGLLANGSRCTSPGSSSTA